MTTYPHGVRVHRPHVNAWLVAVVGLAAALIGLGAWVLVDRYAGGASATENATTLLDKTYAAFNAGDANAMTALYTSDAVIQPLGSDTYTPTTFGQAVTGQTELGAMHVERVAPVTVDGDFATTWERLTSAGTGAPEVQVLSVYQLKDGQILRQWGFAIGGTAPFTNAVTP